MTGPVKPRPYDASRRRAAAAQRRGRVLAAACELFVDRGYGVTTVADIARAAGVAPDTVYALVGPKPTLFRELVETALSGGEAPVPGPDRDYVRAVREAPSLAGKLAVYAAALTAIQGRLAPLFLALRSAAPADDDLRQLWTEISERRARNMRLLAHDLRVTGEVREDLSLDEVADVVWATNSSEFYAALVLDRGWTPERFHAWLADGWWRLLRA